MRNLTMMTDLYQFTMMYGYYRQDMGDNLAVFDLFFRKNTDEISSYCIVAGLAQVVEYIQNIHFDSEDLDYLRSQHLFDEDFLKELSKLRFTGELYAMPEGSVAFPFEPLVRVKARVLEAQFVETALLNIVNHQTLIATKANRIVEAADGDAVLEFGLRRAQGPDAGIYGARAAIIGGCGATSNTMTGQMYDIPIRGTHAHSWVMCFGSELDAFRAYANTFPDSCLLLVDTYDTLKSGVPNAIKVFSELRAKGYEPVGIRLDSGDLSYLSKKARVMLDEADFGSAKIFASGDLEEETIRDLKQQGAAIDVWGVGTKLITGYDRPALGGVYKLSAFEKDGELESCIKLSDNSAKMTNPAYKKVVRLYDNFHRKALADLIMLEDEEVDTTRPLTIFDPEHTWKQTTLTDFFVRDLLVPVIREGELVYDLPGLSEIRNFSVAELDTFWDEYKRFRKPQSYKVDLSDRLYELKKSLIARTKNTPRV